LPLPYIELHGDKYFYAGDAARTGLPVVFCHGSGGSHRHWLYQMEELKGAFNPLAVDLPGHGRSGGLPAARIAAYTKWVHDFTAALGLPPFVLAGHSLGGAIALEYALRWPGELAGLILVGTGGRLRVAPAILDSFRDGQPPLLLFDSLYGEDTAPALLEKGHAEIAATPAEVFLADFTACDNFDVMAELSTIALPSLIICGTADRLTPLKYSRYLKEQLTRGELVEVPGAGHMAMLEAPAAVNRAITAFLERLPG
jgi:pimeloyl-ACP methyl ester carboxylesterase